MRGFSGTGSYCNQDNSRGTSRRRVRADPASKVAHARVGGHASDQGTTVTVKVTDPVRPFASVTIRLTL
jgi:hypothetical protein